MKSLREWMGSPWRTTEFASYRVPPEIFERYPEPTVFQVFAGFAAIGRSGSSGMQVLGGPGYGRDGLTAAEDHVWGLLLAFLGGWTTATETGDTDLPWLKDEVQEEHRRLGYPTPEDAKPVDEPTRLHLYDH